jgi:hypothetical protein
MKHINVLFVLALTAGGLAACNAEVTTTGTTGKARAVAASPSPRPPKEALQAAVRALDATAYNFAIREGTTAGGGMTSGGGRIDPSAQSANLTLTGKDDEDTLTLAYVVIAPALWLQVDFGEELNKSVGVDPGAWMVIDRSKLTSLDLVPIDQTGAPDLGLTDLFKGGLGEVKRIDATHLGGTVDMTVASGLLSPGGDALKEAGDRAKSVPFTATTDEQGRLTSFKIDGGSLSNHLAIDLTFTGFGSVQPITKPTVAIAAPDKVYEILN